MKMLPKCGFIEIISPSHKRAIQVRLLELGVGWMGNDHFVKYCEKGDTAELMHFDFEKGYMFHSDLCVDAFREEFPMYDCRLTLDDLYSVPPYEKPKEFKMDVAGLDVTIHRGSVCIGVYTFANAMFERIMEEYKKFHR